MYLNEMRKNYLVEFLKDTDCKSSLNGHEKNDGRLRTQNDRKNKNEVEISFLMQ